MRKNGQIRGSISQGYYSPGEIELALQKINMELVKLKQADIIEGREINVYIQVDFLNTESFCRCAVVYAEGLSVEELKNMVNEIFDNNMKKN